MKNTIEEQALLTMLTTLEWTWEAAAGIKVLLQNNTLNESQVVELLHMFLNVMYKTEAKIDIYQLKKLFDSSIPVS